MKGAAAGPLVPAAAVGMETELLAALLLLLFLEAAKTDGTGGGPEKLNLSENSSPSLINCENVAGPRSDGLL